MLRSLDDEDEWRWRTTRKKSRKRESSKHTFHKMRGMASRHQKIKAVFRERGKKIVKGKGTRKKIIFFPFKCTKCRIQVTQFDVGMWFATTKEREKKKEFLPPTDFVNLAINKRRGEEAR